MLDPDVIVLGGGMSNITRLYTNVPRLWSAFTFAVGGAPQRTMRPDPGTRILTNLVPARHGDSSGVRGAARLWDAT